MDRAQMILIGRLGIGEKRAGGCRAWFGK